jgi:hypothetical protein
LPQFCGGQVGYEFDWERMSGEIAACRDCFVYTPPYRSQVARGLASEIPFMSESAENYRRIDTFGSAGDGDGDGVLRGTSTFYLRASTGHDVRRDGRFSVSKKLDHSSWYWRPELKERLSYTIQCIESLPYRRLGLVRAFVYENTFLPTHRDSPPELGCDQSQSVGLSLVPATGGVPVLVWEEAGGMVRELHGHCLLLDDSKWHGVPMTAGRRVTIRIFGDLDYAKLPGGTGLPQEYRAG